jgi:FAD/FMN-containing dehydrogenase
VEPGHLAKLKQFPANAAARLLVERLRQQVVALFGEMEATHLQIGRTYLLRKAHDESAWSILRAAKEAVDPRGLMNPGSLGL